MVSCSVIIETHWCKPKIQLIQLRRITRLQQIHMNISERLLFVRLIYVYWNSFMHRLLLIYLTLQLTSTAHTRLAKHQINSKHKCWKCNSSSKHFWFTKTMCSPMRRQLFADKQCSHQNTTQWLTRAPTAGDLMFSHATGAHECAQTSHEQSLSSFIFNFRLTYTSLIVWTINS